MTKQTTKKNLIITGIRTLVILALLCINCVAGYAKPNKVDSLYSRMANVEKSLDAERMAITMLQKEVELFEKSLRNIDEHVDRANEEVSNQIAVSSHTIQVWGWIIAILAILVSIAGIWYARYINKMRKDITHLLSDAQKQLNQAEEASADIAEQQQRVSALQKEIATSQDVVEDKLQELKSLYLDIQKNSRQIYESMMREETISLLHRLEEVPEDVATLQGSLLVRTLADEDFDVLLQAYHNLITQNLKLYNVSVVEDLREVSSQFCFKEETFMLLFAQHFMGKAIEDADLRPLLRNMFDSLFKDYFFINDAEKSTKDLKCGLSFLDAKQKTEVLADYILAMADSQYSQFVEWYNILLSDITEDQLTDIWNIVSSKNSQATFFARTIKEVISKINPQSTKLETISQYIENAEQNTQDPEQKK